PDHARRFEPADERVQGVRRADAGGFETGDLVRVEVEADGGVAGGVEAAGDAAAHPAEADDAELHDARGVGRGGDQSYVGPARSFARCAHQARRAASSVFWSSIAIVIGPTPPGTGVIQPAFSRTASKSTSPTRR